jgi:hypothetical protein
VKKKQQTFEKVEQRLPTTNYGQLFLQLRARNAIPSTAASDARTNELLDTLVRLMDQAEKLPAETFMRLRKEIERLVLWQPLWTQRMKHITRWVFVREARDNKGMGWLEAYKYASDQLIGHPAHAGPEAMKKSYEWVQKHASPSWRRPRSYKRRRPQ